MPAFDPTTRPVDLTIDRPAAIFRIRWQDGAVSDFPLAWLRESCPCATCNEKRAADQTAQDSLRLDIRPSYSVTDAQLVGNYAVQLTWGDGHAAGIYAFAQLRAAWDQGVVTGDA